MERLSVSDHSTPRVLGDYVLLTKLASGGMATVYVGSKRGRAGFERLVAIKCCHPHLVDNQDFVTMFLDEARLAASIRHPNVVGTIDVSHGDVLYLVMDYVEGGSLVSLIKRKAESLPVGVSLRIIADMLAGLHAAHELRDLGGEHLGLVHRDVSPHNVLVGVDGVSRITDFGVAFANANARAGHTEDGQIKGKFAYISPEQILAKPANRVMDVFSSGVVLWEALAGRSLFRRAAAADTIQAVLQDPALPPSKYNSVVPPELDAVVLKALEKDPADRYQTAAEFQEAIERFELADTRTVGALVAETFKDVLEDRRSKLRQPGIPFDFTPSHVRPTVRVEPEVRKSDRPRSLPPGEIEHRRMRGLIAAFMLLLVGGALGLLLSRSSSSAPANATPTHKTP